MKILLLIFSLFFFYSAILSKAFANNLSIKQEIERALDSGLNWLNLEQNKSSGQWGLEEYPALTGLAVRSFLGHPSQSSLQKYKKTVDKGLNFVRTKVQSDGGIYGKGLASYNTSICMMALMQAKFSEDRSIISSARKFLVNQQSDFDRKGTADNVFDGGVGYGSRWAHSDLSNTHLAMEALFMQRKPSRKRKVHPSISIGMRPFLLLVSVKTYHLIILKNGLVSIKMIGVVLFIFQVVVWQVRLRMKMDR